MERTKNYRDLEKIVKGFANHRRIQILELIYRLPGSSVADVSTELGINFKTASEHIRRIAHAGLLTKQYEGRTVRHQVTSLGTNILKFLRMLE